MDSHKRYVPLFSFLLAFCSLFYEFVYAQILSVCIGGTKTQYLITISLFTFALGTGSLLYNYFSKKIKTTTLFFRIELALTILGSLGPFFIAWLLQAENESSFALTLKIYFSYFFIFLIGLFSGFEIPCLFSLMDKSHGKILAWDYLGMLAASLAFPFLFLPYLGTAAGTIFVANINALALIWICSEKLSQKTIYALSTLNFIVFILVLSYRFQLNTFLSDIYLGAK